MNTPDRVYTTLLVPFSPEDVSAGDERDDREDLWRLLADLQSSGSLPPAIAPHLVARSSLNVCQTLLVKESLSCLWRSVYGQDGRGVRRVATMIETLAHLDAKGINCAFSSTLVPTQMRTPPRWTAPKVDTRCLPLEREEMAWGCIERLRRTCLLDELVPARFQEDARPTPELLSDWHAWLLAEAIDAIVLAATFPDNPPSGGGSAWLLATATKELAGVARLYEIGVRPASTIPLSPAWCMKAGSLEEDDERRSS